MALLLFSVASPFALIGLVTIVRGVLQWRADRAFERSIRQVLQKRVG